MARRVRHELARRISGNNAYQTLGNTWNYNRVTSILSSKAIIMDSWFGWLVEHVIGRSRGSVTAGVGTGNKQQWERNEITACTVSTILIWSLWTLELAPEGSGSVTYFTVPAFHTGRCFTAYVARLHWCRYIFGHAVLLLAQCSAFAYRDHEECQHPDTVLLILQAKPVADTGLGVQLLVTHGASARVEEISDNLVINIETLRVSCDIQPRTSCFPTAD